PGQCVSRGNGATPRREVRTGGNAGLQGRRRNQQPSLLWHRRCGCCWGACSTRSGASPSGWTDRVPPVESTVLPVEKRTQRAPNVPCRAHRTRATAERGGGRGDRDEQRGESHLD